MRGGKAKSSEEKQSQGKGREDWRGEVRQDREEKGYEIMTAIPREVNDALGKLRLKEGARTRRADYRASDGAAFSCGEMSGRKAVDGRSISRDC